MSKLLEVSDNVHIMVMKLQFELLDKYKKKPTMLDIASIAIKEGIDKVENKLFQKFEEWVQKTINEMKAFIYLTEVMGYAKTDIKFQYNASPDYVTRDGIGYEIKTNTYNSIYFHRSQFELLKILNNTTILVFDNNDNIPILIFPSNIMSENKAINGIKISVFENSNLGRLRLEKNRLLKYKRAKENGINLIVNRRNNDAVRGIITVGINENAHELVLIKQSELRVITGEKWKLADIVSYAVKAGIDKVGEIELGLYKRTEE